MENYAIQLHLSKGNLNSAELRWLIHGWMSQWLGTPATPAGNTPRHHWSFTQVTIVLEWSAVECHICHTSPMARCNAGRPLWLPP